jgi:hypothetical protein
MSAENPPLTEDERIDRAVAVALGQQGYVTEDGDVDNDSIVDAITKLAINARAMKKSERAKVCVSRRGIMKAVFPKVAGPESWADEPDPELAEAVYIRLDQKCWRFTATGPSGQVQSKLNSDLGLVLCRTKVNPHRTDAVYVTSDLGCILEDMYKPMRAAQKKQADRDAASTVMLIERIPEHGKRFDRELLGGLRTALNSAQATTAGALASSVEEDDVDEDVELDDE